MSELFKSDEIRQSAEHAVITGKSVDDNPYLDPVRHAAWISFYESFSAFYKQSEDA